MKDLIVTTYIAYLPVAILLTFVVAKVFFKNSKIFMLDIFSGRQEIAMSTNKLFETGFYLLSLGFALFYMKVHKGAFKVRDEFGGLVLEYTKQDMFETLSYKIGVVAVFLGLMVFFNLYMLFRGKKKTAEIKAQRERAALK
ncbi:MAG: hypothetical protein COA58_02225 [Bacteroidetes bacterium]|nr:MAG: hypothetical protein COA58_02225 [Bacteroidota bacterium]